MLLSAPSTDDAHYAMFAPPVALALVQTFGQKISGWIPRLFCASYAVLLVGLILNAFFRLKKTPLTMSVQPLGALIFLPCALIWIFIARFWLSPAVAERKHKLSCK